MYEINFLPIAKKDLNNIIYYISHNLKNITAARRLRDLFMSSFDNILQFPYGCSIYKLEGVLINEYRSYQVKNFLIFYTIDEDKKIVTVVRILYQKMDIQNILS